MAARIALVVAVATVLSYWHVRSALESQALGSLEKYVEQRRARESSIFHLAADNLEAFANYYAERLRVTDAAAAQQRFAELFELRPDGTTRLRAQVFRSRGMSGLIGKHVSIDDDLKRRLVAAYDVLARFGPAWTSRFANLHIVTPENAVLMYWPGQPWALNAADWEVFGKLALISDRPDGVVVIGDAEPQVSPGPRWSGLYFDYGINDWMVSLTRPILQAERHLLSVGHDILLHDLIDRVVAADLAGTYNLIFRADGRLIAHPHYMDAIQARSGALFVRDTGDAHLQRLFELATQRRPGQVVVDNAQDNEFLAVTQLGGPGWLLATVFPKAIIADEAFGTARLILLFGAVALLVEFAILFAALRSQVTNPLGKLVHATGLVASGRFDGALDIRRDDEIGELAASFDTMAREIKAREAALHERSARLAELNAQLAHELEERRRAELELARHRELSALLDAIDYGILFLDPELRARAANRAFHMIWGIPEELVARGASARELMQYNRHNRVYDVAPQDWDTLVEGRMAAIRKGTIPPTDMRLADGRVLRYQGVVLPDGGRMLTYLDITEKQRALEAVHAAEQRQRRLLEVAPFPLAVTRLSDGRVLYANARMAETMGVPLESFRDEQALDYCEDPADRTRILEALHREGRVSDVEVQMTLPNGRRIWALMNAALMDYEGAPALLAAFNDITELKDRERQLRDANRAKDAALHDLHAVLDTIDYGVLFLDADLRARLANRAFREIWHIPEDYYDQPRTLAEAMAASQRKGLYGIPDDQWDAYLSARLATIRAGDSTPAELRLADGKVIQHQCIALPDGGRMLTYFDITELKRAEDALRRHLAAMEASVDGMAILDAGGTYVYANAAHARIYGYDSPQELIGRRWRELYSADELARFKEAVLPALTREGRWRGEAVAQRRDGSTYPQDVSLTIIEGGTLICVVRDITERRVREMALQDAMCRAEEASRAKSEFLANMSHELRTPMNAIIGFTRIVMRRSQDVLPPRQRENLEKILTSANHLLGLINDILDLSKIEAGRMEVRAREFTLERLIDECLRTIEPMVERGVALEKDIDGALPSLFNDDEKLRQILTNLLSNAAKFTARGRIRVSARRSGETVEIAVSDTGIGIAEEARDLVFEEFRQVDSSSTRRHGGTGLGLSISRHLARLIGGDIRLDSAVGVGSTFTVNLPLRYAGEDAARRVPGRPAREARTEAEAPDTAGPGRVVLAIDDDPDAILLLKENLADSGFRVVGAGSGEEGLRLAREIKPCAITLDVVMPEMEGWTILAELKADPGTRHIPVILLSIVDRKDMGYRLGAADYLVKPFERDALLAALEHAAPRCGRLLVIDDDPSVGDLVRQLLDGEVCEIEAAFDGDTAVPAAMRARPDVILLDLIMPGTDGFAVLDALRAHDTLREVPVVVLTSKRLTPDERTRLEARVRAVIDKAALDRDTLMRELRRLLPPPLGRKTGHPA
ncbi:MAG: PAS-domain containing protein [Pseudomonadota bacterium]|nr:PAS-domain containing protein [Pseudomonadota bacterium]